MLTYDSRLTVSLDDRLLAHLQSVIWQKLRRGESFAFSWVEPLANGSGRKSIWLSPHVSLSFEYFGNKQPTLNPAWIQALTRAANSTGGLHIVPEPPAPS